MTSVTCSGTTSPVLRLKEPTVFIGKNKACLLWGYEYHLGRTQFEEFPVQEVCELLTKLILVFKEDNSVCPCKHWGRGHTMPWSVPAAELFDFGFPVAEQETKLLQNALTPVACFSTDVDLRTSFQQAQLYWRVLI